MANPEKIGWLRAKVEPINWRRLARRLVMIIVAITLSYHALILYRITELRHTNPSTTNLIELRADSVIERGGTPRIERRWVPYRSISPHLVRAVLVGEDIRFFRHSGIDWTGVNLAIKKNWEEKRFARGGSSISQQLAKNLFLSPSRNPLRKLHEMIIAWEMEQILGKRRILEIYLNVIEWGNGVYGAEAAARHYFGVSAASLDSDQAVFLSAIIPTPLKGYSSNHYSSYIRSRINMISERMKYRIPEEDRRL
jgi:monofunctional biosynthetic peptidoglycan transglycosylase